MRKVIRNIRRTKSNSPTSKARIRRGRFKGAGNAGDYNRLKVKRMRIFH